MVRTRSFAALALVLAAFAAACSDQAANGPIAPSAVAPRFQGGVTDPAAPVGMAGTWKGTLTASYLPTGTARWEFKVSPLTDTSFYAVAREIVPQLDGSSITYSNIATSGKNVGSSVSMRVYIGNAADFTGTLDTTGNNMSGSWLYGVSAPGLIQATGTLVLGR